MASPYFHIIIPVYNVADYIPQCIDSVLSQSFKDYEIILVDDGSTDNSGDICDEYAKRDSRIKVIHKPNGGLSSARNAALDVAKGEFIIFIDSDDYWNDDDGLQSIYNQIEKFKNDIVLFGCINIYDDKEVQTRGNYDIALINNATDRNGILQNLLETNQFPGSAWIMSVKKSLIDGNNLRFPEGVTAEDIGWINTLMVKAQSLGAIKNPIYRYRTNRPGQITGKPSLKGVNGQLLANEQWLNSSLVIEYPHITSRMAHLFLALLMSYSRLSKNDRKIVYKPVLTNTVILKKAGNNIYQLIYLLLKIFGPNCIGKLIYKAFQLKNK